MSRLDRAASKTWLPPEFEKAHELCLLQHDLLAELLRSGEATGQFRGAVSFRDTEDRSAFEEAVDAIEWLEERGEDGDRRDVIRKLVFPAILSDSLHFLFEALECSRKAKVTVAFSLLRKPLQESLWLFEGLALAPDAWVQTFATEPLKHRSQKAGDAPARSARIASVLRLIAAPRFSADYLAQLRYDKSADDGFDGPCNQATHLFTGHKSLETHPYNINFIFSDAGSRTTQWQYIYSRLPYVLDYFRSVVEHVCGEFARTDAGYLEQVGELLLEAQRAWWPSVHSRYRSEELVRYAECVLSAK